MFSANFTEMELYGLTIIQICSGKPDIYQKNTFWVKNTVSTYNLLYFIAVALFLLLTFAMDRSSSCIYSIFICTHLLLFFKGVHLLLIFDILCIQIYLSFFWIRSLGGLNILNLNFTILICKVILPFLLFNFEHPPNFILSLPNFQHLLSLVEIQLCFTKFNWYSFIDLSTSLFLPLFSPSFIFSFLTFYVSNKF